jgi:hypothetical protein
MKILNVIMCFIIFINVIQIQQQPRPTYLAPQQQQNQPIIIWSGILEWHEKVPSSPNKVTKSCVVKAVATDPNFIRAIGEKLPD